MSAETFSILDAALAEQPALARVRRKAALAATARADFEHAIRQAVEHGHTYKEIAEAAGLSSSRVHQIVHEAS